MYVLLRYSTTQGMQVPASCHCTALPSAYTLVLHRQTRSPTTPHLQTPGEINTVEMRLQPLRGTDPTATRRYRCRPCGFQLLLHARPSRNHRSILMPACQHACRQLPEGSRCALQTPQLSLQRETAATTAVRDIMLQHQHTPQARHTINRHR